MRMDDAIKCKRIPPPKYNPQMSSRGNIKAVSFCPRLPPLCKITKKDEVG